MQVEREPVIGTAWVAFQPLTVELHGAKRPQRRRFTFGSLERSGIERLSGMLDYLGTGAPASDAHGREVRLHYRIRVPASASKREHKTIKSSYRREPRALEQRGRRGIRGAVEEINTAIGFRVRCHLTH